MTELSQGVLKMNNSFQSTKYECWRKINLLVNLLLIFFDIWTPANNNFSARKRPFFRYWNSETFIMLNIKYEMKQFNNFSCLLYRLLHSLCDGFVSLKKRKILCTYFTFFIPLLAIFLCSLSNQPNMYPLFLGLSLFCFYLFI